MTEITLIPTEDQTQLLLESPLSDGEKARKLTLEAKAAAAAQAKFEKQRTMAACLLQIYQEALFRGEQGGRSWGSYLASDEIKALGYEGMDTDKATTEMMWVLLCDAIDGWNERNDDRPPLPYPKGRSYMDGWALLFDRTRSGGASGTYARFQDGAANTALQAWYSAVIEQGGAAPDQRKSNQIGRAARDMGMGREALTPSPQMIPGVAPSFGPRRPGAETQPDSQPRIVSPETVAAADQARADRAARQAVQAESDRLDREFGIDPRTIQTVERNELDVVDQCQKYKHLLNAAKNAVDTLQVFIEGKLNAYGSEYFLTLRQVDAGIWSVNNDVALIEAMQERLQDAHTQTTGVYSAGEFDGDYEPEPA